MCTNVLVGEMESYTVLQRESPTLPIRYVSPCLLLYTADVFSWESFQNVVISDSDLDFFGWSPDTPFSICQGDCDSDDQCENDLICFYNDGDDENIAGACSGTVQSGVDYCYSSELADGMLF